MATLDSSGTLAVGYISRPLGGIVCGHQGDRIGRKGILVAALTLMGAATFAIGLLPTYDMIGIGAPILLTICRFLQGVALGGEWGGAVLVAVECAPRERRGLFGSVVQTGATIGLAAATAVRRFLFPVEGRLSLLGLARAVPDQQGMLGAGLYIRLRVSETPAFTKVPQEGGLRDGADGCAVLVHVGSPRNCATRACPWAARSPRSSAGSRPCSRQRCSPSLAHGPSRRFFSRPRYSA